MSTDPTLRRPLFFARESKRPDAVVFGGSVLLILGLLLLVSGGVLLTEQDAGTSKYDVRSHQMMIICVGGVVTLVGFTCFGIRFLTARRVRISIRSSVSEFAHDLSRRLQSPDHAAPPASPSLMDTTGVAGHQLTGQEKAPPLTHSMEGGIPCLTTRSSCPGVCIEH